MSDEDDLEALFDQIATQRAAEVAVEAPVATSAPASEATAGAGSAAAEAMRLLDDEPIHSTEELFDRVGRLTRNLHDALHALGYDKAMEKMVDALPDARDRLTYISSLTQGAAEKALHAVETAKPLQEELARDANQLEGQWAAVFDGKIPAENFRQLALSTHSFLKELPERTGKTEGILLDIMMAQDFHDLTGQVIKKIVDLAHTVEKELVQLLMSASPGRSQELDLGFSGPQIKTEGRTDIVTNQSQVDDLLEQLGF